MLYDSRYVIYPSGEKSGGGGGEGGVGGGEGG